MKIYGSRTKILSFPSPYKLSMMTSLQQGTIKNRGLSLSSLVLSSFLFSFPLLSSSLFSSPLFSSLFISPLPLSLTPSALLLKDHSIFPEDTSYFQNFHRDCWELFIPWWTICYRCCILSECTLQVDTFFCQPLIIRNRLYL